MEKLTIGKLAEAAQVGVETIRFYEKKGLIKKPTSRIGAYRIYPVESVQKIHFIKRGQELGFTLSEIKELMLLDQNTRATCEDVAERAQKKLTEVHKKLQDLKRMEDALAKLIHACHTSPTAKACCKVSDCLSNNCH